MYTSPELVFMSAIYTELQKARGEEKQMNSLKLSFEKQLQNERTLKIQVCLSAYTGLESLEYFLYFYTFLYFNFSFSQTTVLSHHLLLRIIFSSSVELWARYKNLSCSNIDISHRLPLVYTKFIFMLNRSS